jgi:hypothetical protein
MKQPDARAFLFDVQRACQLIQEFTSGMTLQDYAADRKTRSAVERQLEIVGDPVVWGILEGDLPGLAARIEELPARGEEFS